MFIWNSQTQSRRVLRRRENSKFANISCESPKNLWKGRWRIFRVDGYVIQSKKRFCRVRTNERTKEQAAAAAVDDDDDAGQPTSELANQRTNSMYVSLRISGKPARRVERPTGRSRRLYAAHVLRRTGRSWNAVALHAAAAATAAF